MSYMLPHLHNGWQVDQAILSEEDRVLVIRFGHDWDPTCMKMDEVLYSIAEKVKNFAVIYLVDITEVPDFNKMYELYDPCTVMFFFRNKHIMIDLGTGNNNKINWTMEDKQEMIDIVETVYRGAERDEAEESEFGVSLSQHLNLVRNSFHVDTTMGCWLALYLYPDLGRCSEREGSMCGRSSILLMPVVITVISILGQCCLAPSGLCHSKWDHLEDVVHGLGSLA
ncbi:unnamed protein product [Pleuronectes platessa]|uniref:Thioredoxin-like protein 4A n=1 Tax=Pleuronectes platessa TaxID=8262 RepID=A0A9N7V6E7_PLEPL|nr:unnamed protein product [Pleuronectes platessa]